MAGGTGMPMGALAGAALGGRGVAPAPAPAPAPTMAAQPTAQPNATYQPAMQNGVLGFDDYFRQNPLNTTQEYRENVEFEGQMRDPVAVRAYEQYRNGLTNGAGVNQAMPPAMAPQPTAQPSATYQPAMPLGLAPQQGFNVNQAAAGALQGAIGGTQRAMQGPLQVGAYANPYTSAVIDRTQQDIERQRQMAMNTLGAQATAAGAFGGSRHGVAEGVTAGEYGRMAGDMAAQQRQANYSQALQAAMADRQARLGAASQLGGLGQQAFNTGQTIQQNQLQQGLLQQGMQQALIDAAKGQYAGYTASPMQSLAAPLAALGATPNQSTTTESMKPGLLSYLQIPGLF